VSGRYRFLPILIFFQKTIIDSIDQPKSTFLQKKVEDSDKIRKINTFQTTAQTNHF